MLLLSFSFHSPCVEICWVHFSLPKKTMQVGASDVLIRQYRKRVVIQINWKNWITNSFSGGRHRHPFEWPTKSEQPALQLSTSISFLSQFSSTFSWKICSVFSLYLYMSFCYLYLEIFILFTLQFTYALNVCDRENNY